MSGIEAYFAGMANASMTSSGVYFSPGKFRLRSKGFKVHAGHNGPAFVAEFTVLATNNEADPVGSTRSYVVKLGPQNKYCLGEIKAVMFAVAMGLDPKKVGTPESNPKEHGECAEYTKVACDAEYAKKMGLAPDAFEGIDCVLETHQKPTRPSPKNPQGGVFTVHTWSPCEAGAAA